LDGQSFHAEGEENGSGSIAMTHVVFAAPGVNSCKVRDLVIGGSGAKSDASE
jgi:hypothetical protein